jgi:chromosome partitioning protein
MATLGASPPVGGARMHHPSIQSRIRRSDEPTGWGIVGEIIACANQKGGVGKTTTVVSLAAYLALDGHRVLLVDMDPQGNATSGLDIDRSNVERSVYDVLLGGLALADGVRATAIDGLAVLPSDRSLAGAEVELVPSSARERRLKQVLRPAGEGYDFILLDCPPSLGLLTVNALTAADSVLIPLQCEYYALEGLGQLMATIDLIREHLNPRLSIKGVVLTMHDGRTSLSADVTAEVRRHLGSQVFDVVVPRSVRLAEAPSYGQAIATYSPNSRGALAYQAFTVEFLQRSDREPGQALRDASDRYELPRSAQAEEVSQP